MKQTKGINSCFKFSLQENETINRQADNWLFIVMIGSRTLRWNDLLPAGRKQRSTAGIYMSPHDNE